MVPFDDLPLQCLDGEELGRTAAALGRADRKLRIATDRWRRSKRPDARLEDRYIDLRIALESLYLNDFVTEHSSEMRFRLSLFGAWHLAEDLEERRRIRKVLRDAYDTASGAGPSHFRRAPQPMAGARGRRAVRPRESQVRPPRRYLPVASTGVVSWPSWAPKPQRHSSSGPSSKVRTLSISSESTN